LSDFLLPEIGLCLSADENLRRLGGSTKLAMDVVNIHEPYATVFFSCLAYLFCMTASFCVSLLVGPAKLSSMHSETRLSAKRSTRLGSFAMVRVMLLFFSSFFSAAQYLIVCTLFSRKKRRSFEV
jgi:hypothetical protein